MPGKEKAPSAGELAREKLDALLGIKGALRLVTSRVRADQADADLRDPNTFEWEGVTAIIDHPEKNGRLRALTEEGSWVDGDPETLVMKLTDWERRPSFEVAAPREG